MVDFQFCRYKVIYHEISKFFGNFFEKVFNNTVN